MLTTIFTHFSSVLKDDFLQCEDYDKLSHYDKIQLLDKIVFALRNGILQVEKPFFQNLIYKIAIDKDKIVSKIFAKEIIEIQIDSDLLKSLAVNNINIAEELLKNSKSLNDIDLISICIEGLEEIKLVESLVKRNNITEMVTDYIVSKDNIEIVKLLLNNGTAKISISTFIEILQKFSKDTIVNELLIKRVVEDDLILTGFLTQIDDKYKKQVLEKLVDFFPDKILYYTICKSIYSFDFTIHTKLVEDLTNRVNLHYYEGKLSENVLLKFLCSGDVYSFIYGLSKHIETNYSHFKKLVTLDFTSDDYEEALIRAGFSQIAIKASQRILKILYEVCLKEHVHNYNYTNLLRDRILKITTIHGPDKVFTYVMTLIT